MQHAGQAHISDVASPARQEPAVLLGQARSGETDCLDDLAVTGAPAMVAGDGPSNVVVGRPRVLRQQGVGRDQHARRAVAALQGMGLPEAVLQEAQATVGLGKTLDRPERMPVSLHGENQAGAHGLAIQQH